MESINLNYVKVKTMEELSYKAKMSFSDSSTESTDKQIVNENKKDEIDKNNCEDTKEFNLPLALKNYRSFVVLPLSPSSNSSLYSRNLHGKFLFIRHGQTDYNVDSTKIELKKIRCMEKYLDCPLNSTGRLQAEEGGINFMDFDVEIGYVSPMRRCLETVYFMFKEHPKKSNFKFIVHPLITEISNSVHGYISDITESKNKYNMETEVKFDWSLFEALFPTPLEQNTFFINNFSCLPNKIMEKHIEKIYQSFQSENFTKNIASLAKIGYDCGISRLESLYHIWLRGMKFKEFLKEAYKNYLTETNKKVIVVSHNVFIRMLTSKEPFSNKNMDKYPKDSLNINNCQGISIYV